MTALFTQIWSFICAIAVFLTSLLAPSGLHKGSENLPLVSTKQLVMIDAFAGGGQGITNDGVYYYTSGSLAAIQLSALAKLDMETGEIIEKKLDVIPAEFKAMDYDHIGDISYAEVDGEKLLYCSLENLDDNADHVVLLFDTDLNYTGRYAYMRGYVITDELGGNLPAGQRPDAGQFLCDGLPWCAADDENGKLYCSRYKGADRLYVYDLKTLDFLYELPITGIDQIDRIQGAEVYNGALYLNIDHETKEGAKDRIIGKIDLTTGAYETAYVRPITGMIDWEAEGLTIFEKDGKTYLTTTDYDHTVATYIHTYEMA